MCRKAGIMYDAGPREPVLAAVPRIIQLQRHRGPDGEGFYDTAGVSLGHCRPGIIDRRPTGSKNSRLILISSLREKSFS